MVSAPQDPRAIITPDAFSVATELLGTPLARPWRRGAAMAIDLLAIVIVGQAGWLFLGLALALLFFRKAFGRSREVMGKATRRLTFGTLGSLILVATLAGAWFSWVDGDGSGPSVDPAEGITALGLGEAGQALGDVLTLRRTDSEAEFREAAVRYGRLLAREGASRDEIHDALRDVAAERDDAPWIDPAISAALAEIEDAPPADPGVASRTDSLALAYAAAIESGDSARAAELRRSLGAELVADELDRRARRIESLRDENRELEAELERERDSGIVRLLLNAADEIGIGFGWAGLYFTFFLAFWGGRTPGKRIMGIRVLRLDGKSIGLWVAFNRFGGYAASIFTGLLGFAEMFWDANRQALHDRIASTVVVRDVGGKRSDVADDSSPRR